MEEMWWLFDTACNKMTHESILDNLSDMYV